jgi:hypothetical protein
MTNKQKKWQIVFFKRTAENANPLVPALDFLNSIPDDALAEILATLDAVAEGPPPSFRGGLRYVPMRGDLAHFHEVRTKHQKKLYRLFVLEDAEPPGLPGPSLALIQGGAKDNETAFSTTFYKEVKTLGDEYLGSNPRSVHS